MSTRRNPRHSGIPQGATTDLSEIIAMFQNTHTQIAARFITDPEINGSLPGPVGEASDPAAVLPLALFEPEKSIMARHGNGDVCESQVEAIIQMGFSRWRQMVVFHTLDGWSVRHTRDGLELWDAGGLWATGTARVSDEWLHAAEQQGYVLAVYGPKLGVRRPAKGRWDAAAKAEELRMGRRSGMVAAAIVAWQGLPPPDPEPYPGPHYDLATGEIDIGVTSDGRVSKWLLNPPGVGIRHGLIVGDEGCGKTNTLRILNLGALSSGLFVLWAADAAGRNDLSWMHGAADQIASGRQQTIELLRAGANVVAARLSHGGYTVPSSDKPGILLTIDDCQQVFAGNPEATRLAEMILDGGSRAGVALVVTARGVDRAYFGGSAKLRAGFAAGTKAAMGTDARVIYDILRTDESAKDE
jgi:hypothetical protein